MKSGNAGFFFMNFTDLKNFKLFHDFFFRGKCAILET